MKQTKKERTRQDILQAVKTIIHDHGHEAVTVRRLAEVTGYTHTNLYYYFKDLNALLWDVRLEMINDMIDELTSVSIAKTDPVEEIIEAYFVYTDYFYRHPNVFRFFYFQPFIQPVGDERYSLLEERFRGLWQTSFFRLVQENIVEAKQVELAAKTIIYAVQGMLMLSFSSNGYLHLEELHGELSKLIHYLMRK